MKDDKIIAVIARDRDDFALWKRNHHFDRLLLENERKFRIGNTIYIGIYEVLHLVSWRIDEVQETSDAKMNDHYVEIQEIINTNLNSLKKQTEKMKTQKEIDASIKETKASLEDSIKTQLFDAGSGNAETFSNYKKSQSYLKGWIDSLSKAAAANQNDYEYMLGYNNAVEWVNL